VTLLRRRLARLAATRSPSMVVDSAGRELRLRRAELGLALAARRGEPILVGPFLGEVGYELLYWVPFVRRLLREHGVDRDRVTVLSRGGAAVWYDDVAAHSLEILDLVDPAEFPRLLGERRAREAHAKQFGVDELDRELVGLARERVADAHLLHPLLMYLRLRFLWEGLVPATRAPELLAYEQLTAPATDLPLPARFVAVKAYFSDSLPDRADTRVALSDLVSSLGDVVVLANRRRLDEHDEWLPEGALAPELEPRTNLAVQTALVARAESLVCTYGGFAYLGPSLGIPTVAVHAEEAFNPIHLAVARAAFPDAALDVVALG
jgi:hypothetical protein